ncbi:MAG: glutathione S-transferase N-terminal domain-containing protein, partial [Rhodospirillales bacterium]|nr:glutathione S-transferase N-terminal domain-containing protein [Rhodospirillales bacterium]
MIDLYYWPTPNGWKLTILFEELGIPYNVIPVDINKGEQFEADFLSIAPNNRMPAVVDPDGADGKPLSLFESRAIMLPYAGKQARSLPANERGRGAAGHALLVDLL